MIQRNFFICLILFCVAYINTSAAEKEPVDYVNPYMGNISHLLVPTYPTIQLPNSLLRVYPVRGDYTANRVGGLPVITTTHRERSAFNIFPFVGSGKSVHFRPLSYDLEEIKPYYYGVYFDEIGVDAKFTPSHQSAIYSLDYSGKDSTTIIIRTYDGELNYDKNSISGYQKLGNSPTTVYIHLELKQKPLSIIKKEEGNSQFYILTYSKETKHLDLKYGISYIDVEQARSNLNREIPHYNFEKIKRNGREKWNDALGKILVSGDNEEIKHIFYTSLYRTYERMICMSEDGRYFSPFDGKVHSDNGRPFYNDDWIWDTYRAVHPLRTIIDPEVEGDMINSYIRMAEQMGNMWMPTFPEATGDSRRMNSNHAVAVVLDAYTKGVRSFDLEKAYLACKAAITEKTLAPWSGAKAGELDEFYKKEGYFPGLQVGEKEYIPEVSGGEKRQPVAVTLGTVYDEWCLGNIASILGKRDESDYFFNRSFNYRKIYNANTKFFHPKDIRGKFVEPFDYKRYGGMGARDAYGENNGWIYRWDVPHNIGDLVSMMGGNSSFVDELERMYDEGLGDSKFGFYAQLPDHTGNVGQFSMANEPSMHIPYLYNYAGEPWRTQKRIHNLIKQWFRNDLMGVPGDEDGGGLSAFVVFSAVGFYPVTVGLPMYVIGSPMFEEVKLDIGKGKVFTVKCHNYSPEHKYIQSAKLNGKVLEKSWFSHSDMIDGGVLEFEMGLKPNKEWAKKSNQVPPSFKMPKN